MKLQVFAILLVFVVIDCEARSLGEVVRVKRRPQFHGGFPGGFPGGGNFGQSSAQANANAFNQQFGPNGFGSSAANAQAQSFNSQSPFGNFGASASNSFSQGFQAGKGGINGNSAFSGAQSYNLPNGKKIAVSYGAGFNVGPDGRPQVSNSHGISYT